MDIEQIKCVVAVAHCGTFLEAAFQLNRSQSSVSKNVRRLEEELGISLFERTTRKVALTPAGEDFVAYGEQILTAYECILNSVDRHLHTNVNNLNIGSIYFGLNNRLAPLIARFLKLHPTMEIDMKEGTTTPLLKSLRTRELDVVFVSSMYNPETEHSHFADEPEFRAFSCFKDPYYVIVSRNHRFANRKSLSYPELAGESFIATDRTMDVYHKAMQKTFASYGVPFNIIMYCTNIRSVLHMVSQNVGIAILSKQVVEEDDDLCMIPLEDGMIRDTQMLVLNDQELAPHIRAFYRFVKEQIQTYGDAI